MFEHVDTAQICNQIFEAQMASPATYSFTNSCSFLDLSERCVQQQSREEIIPKAECDPYQLVPAVQ